MARYNKFIPVHIFILCLSGAAFGRPATASFKSLCPAWLTRTQSKGPRVDVLQPVMTMQMGIANYDYNRFADERAQNPELQPPVNLDVVDVSYPVLMMDFKFWWIPGNIWFRYMNPVYKNLAMSSLQKVKPFLELSQLPAHLQLEDYLTEVPQAIQRF